jgi:hypothetical protein
MSNIHDIPTTDVFDTFNQIMQKEPPNATNGDTLIFENNSWNEELLSSLSKLLRMIFYSQDMTKSKFIQKHLEYSVSKNYPKKTIDHERFNIMRNLNSKDITIRFFEKIVYQILGFKLDNMILTMYGPDNHRIAFNLKEPYILENYEE